MHALHSARCDTEVVRKSFKSMSEFKAVCVKVAEHELVNIVFKKTFLMFMNNGDRQGE